MIAIAHFVAVTFYLAASAVAALPFARRVKAPVIGVVVVLTTVLIILLVGHFLLRIPFDDLLGIASGATGNPAILVYANRMAPTEQTNIGYAMIFPSATIVKVVGAQIAGLALLG